MDHAWLMLSARVCEKPCSHLGDVRRDGEFPPHGRRQAFPNLWRVGMSDVGEASSTREGVYLEEVRVIAPRKYSQDMVSQTTRSCGGIINVRLQKGTPGLHHDGCEIGHGTLLLLGCIWWGPAHLAG